MTHQETFKTIMTELRRKLAENQKPRPNNVTEELSWPSWEQIEQRDNAAKCIAINDLFDLMAAMENDREPKVWAGPTSDSALRRYLGGE